MYRQKKAEEPSALLYVSLYQTSDVLQLYLAAGGEVVKDKCGDVG